MICCFSSIALFIYFYFLFLRLSNQEVNSILFRKLEYTGTPIRLVQFNNKKFYFYFYIGKNLIENHENQGITDKTAIYTSFTSTSPSLVFQVDDNNIILGCGNHFITIFKEDSTLILDDDSYLYNTDYQCSLFKGNETNEYYISYIDENDKYYVRKFKHTPGDTTLNFFNEISITKSDPDLTNFLCEYMLTSNVLYCIYRDNNNLLRVLIDLHTTPNSTENIITGGLTNFYKIFQTDIDDTLIVFYIETDILYVCLIKKKMSDFIGEIKNEKEIQIDLKRHNFKSVSEHILEKNIFIYCLVTNQHIYINHLNLITLEIELTPSVVIDTTLSSISSSTFAFFDRKRYTIIFTVNNVDNYIIQSPFMFCKYNVYFLIINETKTVNFIDTVDQSKKGNETNTTIEFINNVTSIDQILPKIIKANNPYPIKTSMDFKFSASNYYSFIYHLHQYIGEIKYTSETFHFGLAVCYERCESCKEIGDDKDNKCEKCISPYYGIENKEKQCFDGSVDDSYYHDLPNNIYRKCHYVCLTCKGKGIDSNTNCTTCDKDSGYYPHPTNPSQCQNMPIEEYYVDNANKQYSPCYNTWKNCNGKGTYDNHHCIDCKDAYVFNDNNCICDSKTSYYYYDPDNKYQCLSKEDCQFPDYYLIPNTNHCYLIDNNNKLCNTFITCNFNQFLNQLLCLCIDKDTINNNINNDNIADLVNPPLIINTDNSTIKIFNSSSQDLIDSKKQPNVSYILPSEINKIKEACRIPLSETIIIMKNDTYQQGQLINNGGNNKLVSKVTYKFYYENGTRIDLDICEETKIEVNFPIMNPFDPRYEIALNLSNKKINAYDPKVPFFTDICFEYNSDNYTDVTLKDRYKYYYQDQVQLCPDKYIFKGINFTSNTSICTMETKTEKTLTKSVFDNMKNGFINALIDGNWKVVLCTNVTFKLSILIHNIGHWFFVSIIGISLIIFIWFLCFLFNSIHKYLISLMNDIKELKLEPKKKPMIKTINPIHIHFQNDRSSNIIISQSRAKRVPQHVLHHIYSNDKYDEMEYFDLIKYDNRNFIKHYWSMLRMNHPLIFVFCIKSKRRLHSIKVSVFFTGIAIDFSLSAFFYSDNYILLNYNGNSNFWTDLPVSLYSFLLTSILGVGLNLLTESESALI